MKVSARKGSRLRDRQSPLHDRPRPRPRWSWPSDALFQRSPSATWPALPAFWEMRAKSWAVPVSRQRRCAQWQICVRRASSRRVLQEKRPSTPFHFGSVSGKCLPMSPSPAAQQQRVAHCVRDNIAVRMSRWPLVERHFYAADDQLAALHQAVQVIADAATGAHAVFCSECR